MSSVRSNRHFTLMYDNTRDGFRLSQSDDGTLGLDTGGEIGPFLELRPAAVPALVAVLVDFHATFGSKTPEDIDNLAVYRLSQAMMSKLAAKREQGRGGWHDPRQCPPDRLAHMLIDHLIKGDVVDVANFCAMIFSRDDSRPLADVAKEWLDQITPPSPEAHELARLNELVGSLKAQFESAGRAISDRAEEVRSLQSELNTVRAQLRESEQAREVAEQQLERARGYIDRVNEENSRPVYVPPMEPGAVYATTAPGPNLGETTAGARRNQERSSRSGQRRW